MENNILCGSACVKYILEEYKIFSNKLNIKMNWITELALSLYNHNIKNLEIKCFNSNLFNDFKKFNKIDFDGFYYIKKALAKGIKLTEEEINTSVLQKEIKNSKFIILCTESSIFNEDPKMSGGHFIIITGIKKDKVRIVNPVKDKFEIKYFKISKIIKSCINFGSWRLLIKEEIKND